MRSSFILGEVQGKVRSIIYIRDQSVDNTTKLTLRNTILVYIFTNFGEKMYLYTHKSVLTELAQHGCWCCGAANKLRPYNVTSTNFGFRSSEFFVSVCLHFFGLSRLHFLG